MRHFFGQIRFRDVESARCQVDGRRAAPRSDAGEWLHGIGELCEPCRSQAMIASGSYNPSQACKREHLVVKKRAWVKTPALRVTVPAVTTGVGCRSGLGPSRRVGPAGNSHHPRPDGPGDQRLPLRGAGFLSRSGPCCWGSIRGRLGRPVRCRRYHLVYRPSPRPA